MKKHIHTKNDDRIFVFGSNLKGIHGAGAAKYARHDLGAQLGVGEGLTGMCYALPTCSEPGVPLTLNEVKKHVDKFISVASEHSDKTFFVSAVGCGIAGFYESEIAPLFKDAPSNCDLPPGWR